MRIEQKEDGTHITVSERNLWSMLHKLRMPGSARTIYTDDGLWLHSETDDEHYADRHPPGKMHPETAKFIEKVQNFLSPPKATCERCKLRAADFLLGKGIAVCKRCYESPEDVMRYL